jgi:hypothetical protein
MKPPPRLQMYVFSWFNERRFHARHVSPERLRYRLDLYLRYTVPSLLRQTDPPDRIWLNCRPDSEAELRPFRKILEEAGVLVTFDRLARETQRLHGEGARRLLVVRIDSDDMYHPNALETVRVVQGEHGSCLFQYGYCYFRQADKLREYNYPSPPFYSLRMHVWPKQLQPSWLGEPHDTFLELLGPRLVPSRLFCCLQHGQQVSTQGKAKMCARRVEGERGRVLRHEFGLDDPGGYWRDKDTPQIHRFLALT